MYDLTILFQVWAGAISTVPGNYPLNASYRTAEAYAFQVLVQAPFACKFVICIVIQYFRLF